MNKKIKSKGYFLGIWIIAALTMGVLILIIGYILVKGMPSITLEFLLEEPKALGKEGGIFSVIIGTLYVTALGVGIATPVGVAGAIHFNEYAKKGRAIKIIRFFTEVLAGIPSIIFALFGFAFFVVFLGMGWSILSGGLTLALMILPTIIRTTEEALKTVPMSYREGSLSLGATKFSTIVKVVIPSCKMGVLTGVILGLGRAIGETAAVMFTVGGALQLPTWIMDSTRTMSVHLYMLASEGISEEKTYGTAALLIIIILVINTGATLIGKKAMKVG